MLDTHCHLNLDPLYLDYAQHFADAKKMGITQVIIPGVNSISSEKALEIANVIPDAYAAIGFHPDEAELLLNEQSTQDIYRWLIEVGSQQKVVAIGEAGLDYFRLPDDHLQVKHIKARQKKLLKLQLKAAQELNKPILLHVREAQEDVLEITKNYEVAAVLHCFSGNHAYLKESLERGYYISFAGNVTFKNATDLQTLLHEVPSDKLLLETDAPYLNPTRGEWPNLPANIVQTYEFVAQKLGFTIEELSSIIQDNAAKLFGLAILPSTSGESQ